MTSLILLGLLASYVSGGFVSYDWSVGWVDVSPNGGAVRPVIGINGQWPCPAIHANVGDTVAVTVHNNLGNETTSLHFHGLHQTGTNANDGPPNVVQCPIPPGQSYTYNFNIQQSGTYWYHSHSPGQYTDVTDWYQSQMPSLLQYYLSPEQNTDGGEPVPYSALINEAQDVKFPVQPGKTYYVRFISMAAFAQIYLTIDQHNMTIVEADGIYTQKQEVETLYIATAQRYGVLIQTKETAAENFAMAAMMDLDDFDTDPSYCNPNVTAWLVYDSSKPLLPAPAVNENTVIDDMTLIPWDLQPELPSPHHQITMSLSFFGAYNQSRAGFNNISYIAPKVPTLYSVLSAPPQYAHNPAIYGTTSNPFVLKYNEIVEVVINNLDTGPHPLHIHGHQPQIISRSPSPFADSDTSKVKRNGKPQRRRKTPPRTSMHLHGPPAPRSVAPLRRDTWLIAPGGETTIRFQAKNPGVWLFHCHMEWHVDSGLSATFIEAPLAIQATQRQIPPAMQSICKSQNIPTVGNAGGNTKNWTDLSGAPTTPSNCYGSTWNCGS